MNLKEAARELGVHYQTAYKWVRSGELAAVRIGSRYEVTDAAVDQFLASRRCVATQAEVGSPVEADERRRLTDVHPEDLLEQLEAMTSDPIITVPAIEGFVARQGVEVLGDTCMIAIEDADGGDRHIIADHARADFAAFYNAAIGLSGAAFVSGREMFGATLRQGEPLLMPIVDQVLLRRSIQPELRQYLPDYPVHSLVGAPITIDGVHRGMMVFTRDSTRRPYTCEDERYVVRLADRVATLVRAAEEIDEAWRLRAELMTIIRDALRSRRPGLPFTGPEIHELLYAPGCPGFETELGSITVTPDDRVLAVNPAAERFLGFAARDLHGRRRDHVLLPDQSFGTEVGALGVLRSGAVDYHDSHAPRYRSDGSTVEVAVHRGAVRDVDATLMCIISVARPIHTAAQDAALAVSAVQSG